MFFDGWWKNDNFSSCSSILPAVLQVPSLFMHHIRTFLTFDYSKATISARRVAFSSIFWTNKSKSETIMILPIFGEIWEICQGLPRGWLWTRWGWLGPLSDWLGPFRGWLGPLWASFWVAPLDGKKMTVGLFFVLYNYPWDVPFLSLKNQ